MDVFLWKIRSWSDHPDIRAVLCHHRTHQTVAHQEIIIEAAWALVFHVELKGVIPRPNGHGCGDLGKTLACTYPLCTSLLYIPTPYTVVLSFSLQTLSLQISSSCTLVLNVSSVASVVWSIASPPSSKQRTLLSCIIIEKRIIALHVPYTFTTHILFFWQCTQSSSCLRSSLSPLLRLPVALLNEASYTSPLRRRLQMTLYGKPPLKMVP